MILSIVATPIGNLKDITFRAAEVLNQATLVVAEDTRTSGQLFKLLGITGEKQFVSSHLLSTESAMAKALERCGEHEYIALVTDAGTPAISDPGNFFVAEFRKAYPEASVVPIPGPSAVIAVLSVCGYPVDHFEFVGFIPHKKGKQTLLKKIADTDHVVVFYESPHRIVKTMTDLGVLLGDREIFVAREITKLFEEYRFGTGAEHAQYYTLHADKCRGEFVCVVASQ
jgi:16S rRNA (cytidine1402-2'-O)-methyltransferase